MPDFRLEGPRGTFFLFSFLSELMNKENKMQQISEGV